MPECRGTLSSKQARNLKFNFRFRSCFEQGVSWHSGSYRVGIQSEMHTWYSYKLNNYSQNFQGNTHHAVRSHTFAMPAVKKGIGKYYRNWSASLTSDFAPASSREFLDIQVTIEWGFNLKRVRDMTKTYSQIHRTDKYSQRSSIIWSVWLNGWVFIYELSDCRFKSSCSDLDYFFLKSSQICWRIWLQLFPGIRRMS